MRNSHKSIKVTKRMKYLKILSASLTLVLFGCGQPSNISDSKTQMESEQKPVELVVEDGASVQDNLPTHYAIGNTAKPEIIAGWDIEVRPDGMGLPDGSGSVEDGEELYEEKCSMCHGSFGEGEEQWPKLTGGAGSLTEARPEKTIGSFWPYASTLWDYINRAMPFTAPQSLEPNEVYAITAYVLNMNEIVDDDFVLTRENFASIEMPNKDGFYVDDRPDTNNTRCMKDCKDESKINVVLGPKYSIGINSSESENITKSDDALEKNSAGKNIYESACKVCHGSGLAGAPKLGNTEDWTSRLEQSKDSIYGNALNGLNGMPAKGGRVDLSDEVVKSAVDYMLEKVN